jgi:16S rRNA processing protein RimM
VSAKTDKLVTLGRISGHHGVKGWIKVRSATEPRGNIVDFGVWLLQRDGRQRSVEVEDARVRHSDVIAKLRGIDSREQAEEWIGADIAIERARLPRCAPGEYYWADLEGLEVRTPTGDALGTVDRLLATGSNDVLVVAGERERLIPFVLGDVIREVDLAAGVIVADWPTDE